MGVGGPDRGVGMGRTPVSESALRKSKKRKVRNMNHDDIQFLPC